MAATPLRLVLTGAPGSGKTTVLGLLAAMPEFSSLRFLPELARELLAADPTLRDRREEFHLQIYRRQSEREAALAGEPFVTDRGTVDAFGFHPESLSRVGSSLEREYARYTHVLLLETSARLGPSYYQMDPIRRESADDAMAIEAALTQVWKGHPRFQPIPATEMFDEKIARVVSVVRDSLRESYRERIAS